MPAAVTFEINGNRRFWQDNHKQGTLVEKRITENPHEIHVIHAVKTISRLEFLVANFRNFRSTGSIPISTS